MDPEQIKDVPFTQRRPLEELEKELAELRRCVFCDGWCPPGDCEKVFTPITDCEHKDPVDGCCRNPKNMTPECHVAACPRLHRRIKT